MENNLNFWITTLSVISALITILLFIKPFAVMDLIKSIRNKNKSKYLKSAKLTKDSTFRYYQIGKIEIPVLPLVTSPTDPYKINDVHIEYNNEFFEENINYPKDIARLKKYLLSSVIKQRKINIEKLSNNPLIRMDNLYTNPEDEYDRRGMLNLLFSKTHYFDMLATNAAIDIPISLSMNKYTTLREKYSNLFYRDNYNMSPFSNSPGVEVVVLSNNVHNHKSTKMVLIKKRSNQVIGYRNFYQVSASGYISIEHKDKDGIPNPFITAVEETKQEVAQIADFSPEDFNLLGAALHWDGLYPNLIGYFETDITADNLLRDFCRDNYEGDVYAIPFTPDDILNHIVEHDWTPMSAYAMILTLFANFSNEEIYNSANSLIKNKTIDCFKKEIFTKN